MGSTIWDYFVLPEPERGRLEKLGSDGWELAATGGDADNRVLYLKRPALDLRERVTLEQRDGYYRSRGLEPQAPPRRSTG